MVRVSDKKIVSYRLLAIKFYLRIITGLMTTGEWLFTTYD